MPAKSKAQLRFLFAAEARGELPKGTAREWAHATPNIKKLPERLHKPKKDSDKDRKKSREKAARLMKMASVALSLRKQTLLAKQAMVAARLIESGVHPLASLSRAGFTGDSVIKMASAARLMPLIDVRRGPQYLLLSGLKELLSSSM